MVGDPVLEARNMGLWVFLSLAVRILFMAVLIF